jgi:hypothetical protein
MLRTVTGGALALAVSVSIVVVARSGDSRPAITTSTPDALARLSRGWHRLGSIPAGVVVPDRAVWTGTELVIWDAVSGVRFNPATRQWRRLPRSPLTRRALVVMAWTGKEVLVWGGTAGFTDTGGATPFLDGAAYNPRTDRWRRIPPAPIRPRLALGGVWTGSEFVVSGGPPNTIGRAPSTADAVTDGAAYDPATNRWRTIAAAPIRVTQGVVRWTGRLMLVFGSLRTDFLDPQGSISDAHGALYDPTTNRWQTLPSPGLNGVEPTAAVTAHHVVAVGGYVTPPKRYPLNGTTWVTTSGFNAKPQEACAMTVAAAGNSQALISNCGEFWSLRDTSKRWNRVPSPMVAFEHQPWGEPIWTGHAFLYWATNPWSGGPTPSSDASRKALDLWAYVP